MESLLRKNFNLDISEVYATNLFPFVKPEGMSAAIPLSALRRAAKDFALPQIKILQPKLVITLGLNTFNALRYALNLSQFSNLEAAISQPFELDGTKIWCHAHTGALGRANRNRGSVDRATHDWSIMANWFHNNSV